MAEPEILFEQRGAAGIVTLNRPQALNALTLTMVRALASKLRDWASDAAITRVVVTAAGERAFCAGGDIRALYELGVSGRHRDALAFWHDEYRLNACIKHYPKPYISLIDGVVMGGGVGISVHGSHRVAGDKFLFAMPEVGIGFFPDVGATWFLPRMPGEIGAYCALTGERLKAGDGLAAGVATHRVSSARFPALLDGLCGSVSVDALLAAFAEPGGEASVTARRPMIEHRFAGGRVETILAALDAQAAAPGADAEWARATAARMRAHSPTSLKLALAQLRRGGRWDFDECMRAEFRIVSRIVYGHDFYEGVRAVIIDKDDAPQWRPPALADVADTDVEHYFAPLGADELVLG
jgi:enoyl-CoA hydratase